jgi:metal-sulfur cluster biosynthetic enzyme
MVDLVLTGPTTSISAYGCFAIKIDIPAGTAAGSSKGDAGGSIKWEWDCYDPKYAEEVDKPPVTRTISSLGPGRNVEVTYAVMSNALEATVQVKMRTKDGNSPCSVHGLITARVGNFEDQIILFKRTQGTAHYFSPTHSNVLQVPRSLKLARNVVAVPCGQMLHIEMHLNIETCKNQGVSNNTRFDGTLSFINGIWSERRKVDDVDEVEVNVTWYPDSFSDSSGRSRPMQVNIENIAKHSCWGKRSTHFLCFPFVFF